jgi:predicted transcriptional regulator YdeE/DNA-binding transcriptional MerR regulator/effector-binding domain-containing protein
MLKIGELSRLAQVSVKTLRYYAERGLLLPAHVDRYTGYRYYALEQLPRLNRILALKDLGFTLEEIARVLGENLSPDELRGMVRLRQIELERRLAEEQARLTRVEARLRQIAQEGCLPEYPVVLKAVAARRVMALGRRVAGYGQGAALVRPLLARLQAVGLPTPAAGAIVTVYREDADGAGLWAATGASLERIPAPHGLGGELEILALPAIPALACVIHQGSHDALGDAYGALLSWAAPNGYRANGLVREVYLRGPESDAPPEEYVSEVQLPVASVLANMDVRRKEQLMHPKIETKPAFSVVGLVYHGKNEHREIPALWDQLNPRWGELLALGDMRGCYGVCDAAMDETGFDYMAGLDLGPLAQAPEGMAIWQVPEATYAVFTCTLPTIGATHDYIHNTWLPNSGYRRAPTPDLELYPETFEPGDPESEMYIYIPIIR